MSAYLALGAAAALAGLAALRARQGSRSDAIGVRFQRRSNERIHHAMRNDDDDLIAVEVFKVEPGKKPESIKKIKLIDLFDDAVAGYTQTGVDFDQHSTNDWITGLDDGIKYFSRLSFPLQVYRGLRYSGGGEPNLGEPGASWTPDREIAERFADGTHFAASKGDTGSVLTAILPTPECVDWASTLGLYVAYSAFTPLDDEVERQIRPITSLHLRQVQVLP